MCSSTAVVLRSRGVCQTSATLPIVVRTLPRTRPTGRSLTVCIQWPRASVNNLACKFWLPNPSPTVDRPLYYCPPPALEAFSSQTLIPNRLLHRYTVRRSKETTARITVWRECKVINSYTIEASYCGVTRNAHPDQSEEAKPGHQITPIHLSTFGSQLLEAIDSISSRLLHPELTLTTVPLESAGLGEASTETAAADNGTADGVDVGGDECTSRKSKTSCSTNRRKHALVTLPDRDSPPSSTGSIPSDSSLSLGTTTTTTGSAASCSPQFSSSLSSESEDNN